VKSTKKDGEFCYHELREATFLANRFKEMREEIDNSPIPGLPLHITEYNSTTSTHEIIHDIPFNAAFLARTLSEAQEADSLSYWAVSDIFVEETIPRAEFHGGFGMINIHDIPKPTFNMFSFFSQLGTTVLDRSENSLFTRRDDGHIVGVLWNPNDENRDSQEMDFRIDLPCEGNYKTARTLLLDEGNANPYRVWEMMGRERNPSRKDIELLREASQPLCQFKDVKPSEKGVRLDLRLGKNAVQFVEFMPIDDHTKSYYGLNQDAYSKFSI
jgi:xylan 1,4-beta-xylosidase